MNYIIDRYTIFFIVFIFVLSNTACYFVGGYNMINKFIRNNKENDINNGDK